MTERHRVHGGSAFGGTRPTHRTRAVLLLVGCLVLAPATATHAQQPGPLAPADDLRDLMTVLDEQTELATLTRLNVDRVPGIMSVQRADALIARGARTVLEGLELFPQVQVSMSARGTPVVVLRGVGKTFRSGKFKVQLNDTAVNSTMTGEATWVYGLSLDLVDRIEVIQGPGSAVYGEYAYAGIIHIVTRSERNAASVQADRFGGVSLGLAASERTADGRAAFSVVAGGFRTSGPHVRTGPDSLHGTPNQGVSLAPGLTDENQDNAVVIGTLTWRQTTVEGQFVRTGFAEYFGLTDRLPPSDLGITGRETWRAVTVSQAWAPTADWTVNLGGTLAYYALDTLTTIAPPGFRAGRFVYPDGQKLGGHRPDRTLSGEGRIDYRGLRTHRLGAGVEAAGRAAGDFYRRANYHPFTGEPLAEVTTMRGALNVLIEGATQRRSVSLFAQDEWSPVEALRVTVGARVDAYDDFGAEVSPRIAGVWNLSDQHTVKAQYATAFRPPTFIEQYSLSALAGGDLNLRPERIRTLDLSYNRSFTQGVLRVTAFRSDLPQQIAFIDGRYRNAPDATLLGGSVDLDWAISERLRTDSNVSYVRTRQQGRAFPDIAPLVGNAGLVYSPHTAIALGAQYRYRGSRARAAGDPRPRFEDQHAVDLTGQWSVPNSRVRLRAGLRNVLGSDLRMPAPPRTYAEDYPRPGRELSLGASVGW